MRHRRHGVLCSIRYVYTYAVRAERFCPARYGRASMEATVFLWGNLPPLDYKKISLKLLPNNENMNGRSHCKVRILAGQAGSCAGVLSAHIIIMMYRTVPQSLPLPPLNCARLIAVVIFKSSGHR